MQVKSEKTKITRTIEEGAWKRRKPGHRLIIRDTNCRGLALVVNSTSMAWIYSYRPRGVDPNTGKRWPNRTVTLGNTKTHSPDAARTAAERIKGQAKAGDDPAAEKKAAAAAASRKRATILGRLVDDYAKGLPKRPKMRGGGLPSPRYVADELGKLRLALTSMEGTPVTEFGAAEVRRVAEATADMPATARGRFGALSRFLDWCQDAGHVALNPCTLIARGRRPKPVAPRSNYLRPAELARLWRAAERLEQAVWRDLIRFLIAVPCRRGEATHLDWTHLDLEAAEWRQPAKMTKNRDAHRLHLHPLALEVSRRRHEETNGIGLVFPAPKSGKAVDTFTALRTKLTEATGLTGWTWHDFRRSFATALGEAGIPEAVADAVLNHRQSATRGGVLGVYQRASRWPEQVKAMELWGRLLAAAIEGREADANVVAMTARVG